ncbi:hypothetical protein ACFVHI_36430 [Kitasatospora sp. NPDC127121]|uniref:hypothetical protein n=1 Tax=Kitasatospora sp. NPDC127121 TaxID=3345371 RepID=UPI00362DCE5F
MIKRVVVGVAATALFSLGAGVALAQTGAESTAVVTAFPATGAAVPVGTEEAHAQASVPGRTGEASTANWHWVNGGARNTVVTPAGWSGKRFEE